MVPLQHAPAGFLLIKTSPRVRRRPFDETWHFPCVAVQPVMGLLHQKGTRWNVRDTTTSRPVDKTVRVYLQEFLGNCPGRLLNGRLIWSVLIDSAAIGNWVIWYWYDVGLGLIIFICKVVFRCWKGSYKSIKNLDRDFLIKGAIIRRLIVGKPNQLFNEGRRLSRRVVACVLMRIFENLLQQRNRQLLMVSSWKV